MFQQDYIMRQIRQLTHFLTQVLLKKKEGQQQEAQMLIEQALSALNMNSSKEFQNLSLPDTLSYFEYKEGFRSELALAVADLLYEKRELLDQKESVRCSQQALLLYQKAAQDTDAAFPLQAYPKMDQLKEELTGAGKLGELKALL